MIEQTLALTGGNVTQTAKKAWNLKKGLQLKMKELSIRKIAAERGFEFNW